MGYLIKHRGVYFHFYIQPVRQALNFAGVPSLLQCAFEVYTTIQPRQKKMLRAEGGLFADLKNRINWTISCQNWA